MTLNFFRRYIIAVALLVAVACLAGSAAEAWVKVTLNNNRSHKIFVAFCWSGFDLEDDRRIGWYPVDPGQSREINLGSAVSSLTMDQFGFYAMGTMSNGKKVTWSGDLRRVIIDPKNPFDGHPDDPVRGGVEAGFRQLALTKVGDRNMDAVATLTFNP
ncbi:MAG: hypothetical protein QM441_01130 [Synergistota bacterium]|jgi:hypothetical protein|nr:hypothetical protein [Synergistota bacterium]OPZ40417.1 MAG: hypothetical protein BWY99_00770 [Synergistetes bacterium ADurb.BinA166]